MSQRDRANEAATPRPNVDAEKIRVALKALEGVILEDFQLPLPGDLKELSQAADLVSSTIEVRIPELLNAVRNRTWGTPELEGFEFRKAKSGFPDVLLVERTDPENIVFEIEAKSWYILARDTITARFLTDPAAITPGTLVVIVGWVLDGVVNGSPKLLRVHIDDATRLAEVRDRAWEAPEHRRVVRPDNPPDAPRNLRSTQCEGQLYKNGEWVKDRDNYGKLHRIQDTEIRDFIEDVLDLEAAGKTFREWRAFITGNPRGGTRRGRRTGSD